MEGEVRIEGVENRIYQFRGKKVMLDRDLASMYGVSTKRLNEQVKRNITRFPADFMFRLNREESALLLSGISGLRSQIATSKKGGVRYLPYVFTEQGVAMLSTVLNSERAIQVNIVIMRAFVKLRHLLAAHKDMIQKLDDLESRVSRHDEEIAGIFTAIRQLVETPVEKPKRRIGFRPH